MSITFSSNLFPFDVARILGTSGLEQLVRCHRAEKLRESLEKVVSEEAPEMTFAKGGASGASLRSAEETVRRQLFPAAMLFQSSMEAKLMLAADHNAGVNAAIRGERNFANRWQAALTHVGQPIDEFENYAEILYRNIRNPIVHLYDNSDAAEKLRKINAASFQSVYTGVRYGWWAYVRLLHGLELTDGNLRTNWDTVCCGVGLAPDLFPDHMPVDSA